jgi:hypothetical protein
MKQIPAALLIGGFDSDLNLFCFCFCVCANSLEVDDSAKKSFNQIS